MLEGKWTLADVWNVSDNGGTRDGSERRDVPSRSSLSERMASLGTLAAGLAHEINNPLTYVLGNLDVALASLEVSGADRELLEMLREARQGAIRVSEIVRSMRVFARAEPNASKLADVDCVVESALAMAKNEIRHRARLVKRLGAPPIAAAHEATLVEVVLHLLMNAAQAIPEGQVDRDEIAVTTGLDANGRVFIEVRDTGVGMTPDTMRRIFDPFFTTKEVGRGMGLGLSLVHSAVTAAGGDVSVASAPGAGSTFRVRMRRSTSSSFSRTFQPAYCFRHCSGAASPARSRTSRRSPRRGATARTSWAGAGRTPCCRGGGVGKSPACTRRAGRRTPRASACGGKPRVVDRVAALVEDETCRTPRPSALDLEHLMGLELLEARVGEVERDADGGDVVG
ncbi:MAG: hypothetical protein KF850_04620 [Labilithrix sp.]|nr:hypothetical protein [Labilithrix sp.]